MQMASLFTSIQQVETRCRKEEETIEEYNRHKALANLTRARFMKQMENFTKQLKNDTPLTHNYSIPKSTNQTVLTNTLAQKIPNNILIPDIEANVQEQLEKLKISNSLLTTTKNPTGTSLSSARKTAEEEKSTTLQITSQIKKLQLENPTQKSKVEIRQVSRPQDQDTRNMQRTVVDSTKQKKENPNQLLQPKHVYAEISQKKNTPKITSEQEEKIKDKSKEEYCEEQDEGQNEEQGFSNSDEEQALSPPKKHKRKKPTKLRKLRREEHLRAYPWADKASKNCQKKSNLAEEVEYIRHTNITNMLTGDMKKLLNKKVKLPKEILQEIEDNIDMNSRKNKIYCKICSHVFPKKYHAQRHVRIEMGYHDYRCSFCNFLSNTTANVTYHYATRHGIPKDWVTSQNLSMFNMKNSDTDTDF